MGRLTATGVKQAKAGDNVRKLTDGGGLHLQVQRTCARYWRYDYRYAGKRKILALGVYPEQASAPTSSKAPGPGEKPSVC